MARRTLVLLAALALTASTATGQSPPPPETAPEARIISGDQIKVNRVDASNPGRWRIFASAMRSDGKPFNLMEGFTLSVLVGQVPAGGGLLAPQDMKPAVVFQDKTALKGYSGKIAEVKDSKGLQQYAVLVVGLHADVPEERIAAWEKDKFLAGLLAGLREDASVTVLFYRDRIDTLWSPDGTRNEIRDINEYDNCLGPLRKAAGAPFEPEKGGPVPCGRFFPSRKGVEEAMKSLPPAQGLFPRLFGIPESPEVMCRAGQRGHQPLDKARLDRSRTAEPFATGAVEAALRLLLVNSPPDAVREIILVSDGRDGYLRFTDLITGETSRPAKPAPKARAGKGKAPAPDSPPPSPCGVARGDVTGRCQEIVARCERPEARSRAGRAADDDGKAAGKQDLEQCIRKLARKLRGEESPCSLLSQCLEVIRPRKCRMIGDRCEWVGSQGLAPRGLECQKKDDGCAPGRIPRPPPDELVVETAQAGQHVDRKAAEFQAKVLLCSVPAIQAELASREKAARDYLDGLIAALRGAGVRVHAVSIPGADEVGVARLKALATRTGGTFREARSDDANPAIVKNLVAELGQEVVIEPSDDLEPGARYAVALKAASVDGEHEFETPRGFEFRAGPRVWFFEGPWDKARSWLIRKLPDGHFWGPITLWTAAVLAGLLALLFIRMIAKVIWGLLKKLFGKKPDIKPPAAPKMPKLERPKMQVPQVKAPQPPRIK